MVHTVHLNEPNAVVDPGSALLCVCFSQPYAMSVGVRPGNTLGPRAQAMNRSLANVILGGYTQTGKAALVEGTAVETTVESTVEALTQARSVIIVPGCGPARGARRPAPDAD
jgi:hypothetical protein